MKQWYEELFANYGNQYEKESFTKGTMGEVDFIEKEIASNRAVRILDVGCGTGRHAVELAVRGYHVTGVDLSASMLEKARRNAEENGVSVRLLQGDARKLEFDQEFDLVIMLCEGAFSLMETDEMNFEILRGVNRALAPDGKLIMTTLNGLYPLFNGQPVPGDPLTLKTGDHAFFDLMTFRERAEMVMEDDDQQEIRVLTSERFYTPAEMMWLLKNANFYNIEIFGGTLGAFNREEGLTPEHFEMLITAISKT